MTEMSCHFDYENHGSIKNVLANMDVQQSLIVNRFEKTTSVENRRPYQRARTARVVRESV